MTRPKARIAIKFRSKIEMAQQLGVDRNTITNWCAKDGFPGGVNGPWLLSDVFRWEMNRKGARPESDDPTLDGPASPALEEYRWAKAGLAKLELAKEQKKLISRESIREVLGRWAGLLRQAGEILGQRFGADAQRVLSDALDGCESAAADVVAAEVDVVAVCGAEAGQS